MSLLIGLGRIAVWIRLKHRLSLNFFFCRAAKILDAMERQVIGIMLIVRAVEAVFEGRAHSCNHVVALEQPVGVLKTVLRAIRITVMKKFLPKYPRILAIAPSTRGFGFALLEGLDMLVDWGVKPVKGDKNSQSLVKVEELVVRYQPDMMVLQDTSSKESRRSERIRTLSKQIISLAATRKISVTLFSREQVMKVFFADSQGTKQTLAEIVANKFPEELGFRLPPKRRPWMSEDSRMDIFDAMALVLMLRPRKARQKKAPETL